MTRGRHGKLLYKTALRLVPHALKYAIVTAWQRTMPPYHLVKRGDTVVQIGVAGPLCPLGRSQAIVYSLLVGESGKIFAFEAIPENLESFRKYVRNKKIDNINSYNIGLWKEKRLITFDAAPPGQISTASRIKETRVNVRCHYSTVRKLPVDTLDKLLSRGDTYRVDLINITTNGGEPEILSGAMETLTRFRPIVSMPAREENIIFFDRMLAPLGYRKHCDTVRLRPLGKPFDIVWGTPEHRATH